MSLAMKAQSNPIIEDCIKTIRTGIADMEGSLACLILDGTPYVLVTQVNGVECFYGYPAGASKTAFYSSIRYGHLLCGTHQYAKDSAERHLVTLKKDGIEATYKHSRDIIKENLASARKSLALLEAALAA